MKALLGLFQRSDVFQALAGAGPKTIAGTARYFDIPASQPELRKKVMVREVLSMGLIAAISFLSMPLVRRLPIKWQRNPLSNFLPMCMGYVFSEWYSRKVTNFNKAMNDAINTPSTNAVSKPLSCPLPHVAVESNPVARKANSEAPQRMPVSYANNPYIRVEKPLYLNHGFH